MLIYGVNIYELISLIGLCLRLGGCEVMDWAQSCSKTFLLLISGVNGCELISLFGLHLRLGSCEVMDRPKSCGETILMLIFRVMKKYLIYFS